jgi:cobalt/nickel transport system ATP-binding protein
VNGPVLDLRAIEFHYSPDRPVLRGLDLALGPGERVGLVGANGSGKTTLLHLIVGLVKPHCGQIKIFGKSRETEADFREVRRKAGLLFQDSDDQLFCPTVGEDIAFGPLNLGATAEGARQIVARTLETIGLPGYEDRITYKLSGGEKRLVALGTVLAMFPDLLLLDEPLLGLDEEHVERITHILRDISQSVIIVSHDIEFLEAVTGGIRRLRNGRIDGSQ